jgi:hypothetical protein
MTDLAWTQVDWDEWAADMGGIGLVVRKLATGEWTWEVWFPDLRVITARHPHLTRQTAQAAAQRAAAE